MRDHDVSPFWRQHLDEGKRRGNYPEFEEMLVMRRGFTYPLADRSDVADIEQERAYAEGAWHVISRSMELGWFDRFEESSLGAPVAFELDGHVLTGAAVVNGLTASRIAGWCERAGLLGRPLRVLEIGAGYGQVAHQLMQVLEIESYTVCDLPENLFLGAFYLQGNFPDRVASFVKPGERPDAAAGLTFTVPAGLGDLEGPFDLIVNSYSFQEMNRESVEEYFEYASRNLAGGGIFYSLNAHGKAGIERPSQYPVELFDLIGFGPVRRFPWQVFATNPYELVMAGKGSAATRSDPGLLPRGLDGLGTAFQLGLHDELLPLTERFTAGTTDQGDRDAIESLAAFAEADSLEGKRAALDGVEIPAGVSEYLRGSLDLVAGASDAANDSLTRSLQGLSESHARVRALIYLRNEDAALALAPHLEEEIRGLAGAQSPAAALLASQLSLTAEQPSSGLISRMRNRLTQEGAT